MPNTYAEVRRRHRDIDTERDLHALWRSERFEDEASIADALRVYEMAIRVDGWDTVKTWARQALEGNAILRAQLVELAMRALEQADDEFFVELTDYLLQNAPPSYFKFWYALFVARHSHRGERLFRQQLAEKVSDYQVVKYRRWIRKIFRKLRFRCHSDRETAIGAIAFGMYSTYGKGYRSEIFTTYIAAHVVANTRYQTSKAKPITKAKHAEMFADAAAPLRMWSIAEGIRTSAKIPRTLQYLATMAPSLSDLELLRALKAFDAKLMTADHKKAGALVSSTADHIAQRLGAMDLPIEEWAKILPYQRSPVLTRVLETILGERLDILISGLKGLAFHPVPIVDSMLKARAYRSCFLVSYLLHRASQSVVQYVIRANNAVSALSHPSKLWPMGIGMPVPAGSWRSAPEPHNRHQAGFSMIRDTFVAVADQRTSTRQSVDMTLRTLRAHLHRRAVVDGQTDARDVPIVFLPAQPRDEERAALIAHLSHFSAAVIVLTEQAWKPALDAANIICVEGPSNTEGMLAVLQATHDAIETCQRTFPARKANVDHAIRELLLAPAPVVSHVVHPL